MKMISPEEGLSTNEALQRLESIVTKVLFEVESNKPPVVYTIIKELGSKQSPMSVLDISVTFVVGILLFVGITAQSSGEQYIADKLNLIFISLVFLLSLFLTCWMNWIRINEPSCKLMRLLLCVKEARRKTEYRGWQCGYYPSLYTPLASSCSLQWTYRDGQLVNLPTSLLVEDDVILVRPGQRLPARVQKSQPPLGSGVTVLYYMDEGDLYCPLGGADRDVNSQIDEPLKHSQLERAVFIVQESPVINHIKSYIESPTSMEKSVSVLDNQKFGLSKISFKLMLIVYVLTFFVNSLKYFLLSNFIVDWRYLFLVQQCLPTLPLISLLTPTLWVLVNTFNVASIYGLFSAAYELSSAHPGSDISEDTVDGLLCATEVDIKVRTKSLLGDTLSFLMGGDPRHTSQLCHALGYLTNLCCVDKKGLLSWPNPTPEKIFFFTSSHLPPSSSQSCGFNYKSFPMSSHSSHSSSRYPKVMDLSIEDRESCTLRFDDPDWSAHINSLKPLGLSILANTCNSSTWASYIHFLDYLSCASTRYEKAINVAQKRCLCQLSRAVGFSRGATRPYSFVENVEMFQTLDEEVLKSEEDHWKFAYKKRKTILPSLFSVYARDSAGTYQVFTQGTADILVDLCTDFWDGSSVLPMSDTERRRILDFYSRHSLTDHCTAFTYRPIKFHPQKDAKDYVEIPVNKARINLRARRKSVSKSASSYSTGTPSLESLSDPHDDGNSLNSCYRGAKGQVFLGLVAMQYQAKPNIVTLIDALRAACIRFIHFSKENEVRSRVFSEKMGLESGWNCHISLLEGSREDLSSPEGSDGSEDGSSNAFIGEATVVVDSELGDTGSPHVHFKKPVATLVDRAANEVENNPALQDEAVSLQPLLEPPPRSVSDSTVSSKGSSRVFNRSWSHNPEISGRSRHISDCSNNSSSAKGYRHTPRRAFSAMSKKISTSMDSGSKRRFGSKKQKTRGGKSESVAEGTNTDSESGDSGESSMDDIADSVMDLENRAKLPKGIANIRPHLDSVDNVPLLVHLFTDTTPATAEEMLVIMREYGEIAGCLGSSANSTNPPIYLQADISVAVHPTLPQVCLSQPQDLKSSFDDPTTPLGLSSVINTLPCAFTFHRDDSIYLLQLISQARRRCCNTHNAFLLLFSLHFALSLLILLSVILCLPPVMSLSQILMMLFLYFPAISLSMIGNSAQDDIMLVATIKNSQSYSYRDIKTYSFSFISRFVPSVLVVLVVFSVNLFTMCGADSEADCVFLLGNLNGSLNGSQSTPWYGWKDNPGLNLCQNISSFLFLLYMIAVSGGFVFRMQHLIQRKPTANRYWLVVTIAMVTVHGIYSTAACLLEVPMVAISAVTYTLGPLWLLPLVVLNEFYKRREIRITCRARKRAKLQFGTKLGMNSPF